MNVISKLLFIFCSLASFAAQALQMENIIEKDKERVNKLWRDFGENPSAADQVIRYLMDTDSYQGIRVLRLENGQYMVEALKLQKIAKVEVKGLRRLEETDVLNALSMKPGSAFDKRKLDRGIERLRELYGKNGYFNPEFDINLVENDEKNVIINISVTENKPCVIKNVVIDTENKDLVKKLQSRMGKLTGENFADGEIRDFETDIIEYLKDNRYLNARLVQKDANYNQEKTEATISYEIQDPYYFRIEISGNKYYTFADLMRAVDLESFDRTSLNPAAEIADKMKNHYIDNGFAFVKIQFNTITKSEDFIRFIQINVEEGQRIRIQKLDIAGQMSRPSRYYKDFILENSSEAVADDFYVKEDLELGYKNLITALNNEGFLKAKVLSSRADFDDKRNDVSINILIDEGPLTKISNINFKGNEAYTSERLKELLVLDTGSALKLNLLEQGLSKITNFYTSRGYIEAKIITPQKKIVKYNARSSEANVEIEIYEGPKVFVRDIIIEGNNFTDDYVVLKQLDMETGALLTPERIESAQKSLLAMNIFSRVELRTLEHDTMISERVLLVSVTEKNPGNFRIGFGLNNKQDITARGFAGITYSNLFGTGRGISLRGNLENNLANTDIRSYDVSLGYLEPFLFDTTTRGRVELSRQVFITGNKNDPILDGKDINKLGFFAEKDFSQNIRLIWNTYSLEAIKTYQVPEDSNIEQKTQVATVGPILDLDFRDNPFAPTSGTFTRIEVDFSSPEFGSSKKIGFIRSQATFSFYQNLYKKKWIWANSIRGGFAKNLNTLDGSGIPDSYAFFLGGYTTIRGYSGFEDDRIPNNDELLVEQDNQLIIPAETSYQLIKSEIRFPITGIIGGVIFYDAGAVSITNAIFVGETENKNRTFEGQSAGLGFRINTPVGPISLDYGRKINSDSKQKDQLHLSIGAF